MGFGRTLQRLFSAPSALEDPGPRATERPRPARADSLPEFPISSDGGGSGGVSSGGGGARVAHSSLFDAVFSNDAEVAASGLERLCEGAKGDVILAAALGTHPHFLPRLRELLLTAGAAAGGAHDGAPNAAASARERLLKFAAYIISVLAGKSTAIDAQLLNLRFVPALAEATRAAWAGAWGVRRGTLRAIAKLLESQPACAAAQLVACGGVKVVAALLPGDGCARGNCGISRRALAILHAVAGVAPGGLAAAGLLQPELLASLVHLLGSGGKESEHEAAAFVAMLIEREPSAARPLAAAGAGPALAALAGRCSDGAERERAAAALAGLRQHLGGVWQSEAPRQGRPPQAPQSLAAAAMQRVGSGGLARPPRPMLGMGRANSAPLTAVPEAAQQQGQLEPRFLEGSPGLGSRSNVSPASSFGSLQRWAASQLHNAQQQQQQQQHSSAPQQLQQSSPFAPQRPQQQAPFALQQAQQQSAFAPQQPQQQQAPFVSQQPPQQSPFAPQQAQQQFAFAAQPDASGAPQTVSGLVAALRSGQLRSQLVAAEQMGSLAGAGGRAAAIITSAGGASALAACVCDSAAGPVGLHDTLADAFEAALGESLCIAALRSLCTLAQHHLPAATALPLATSPALRLLLRGPDAQQRQLAAMLLASMQAAGADPMASGGGLFNPGDLPAQFSADSPDLLPLSSVSLLSELPHPSTLGSDAADRQLAGDTPGGVSHRRTFSTEADSPAGAAQPSALRSGGGRRSGDAAGMRLGALSQLPSAARRALGEQLAVLQRPPLPPGPWRSGELARAGSSGLHASGDLLASHEDSSGGGGGLWGLASEGSASEAATPGRAASGDLWGSDAGDPPHGGATTAGAAGDDGGDGGGGGLLLPSSDIEVCQLPNGKEWKLGEGGFGVVLKGLMHGVDEVAVKRIRAEVPSDAELAAFHREMRALAALRHRNLVQFYGACLEPGSLMIVTELMKGGDLYAALRRHPETLAWGRLGHKVALDVALGLHYLHSRRPPLTHRDLKSPNVLLSEEGVAKIADVGMLRCQATELITAQPVLTPLWAAPEVLRRDRAGVKADIWSFGILVFEIALGVDIAECTPLAFTCHLPEQAPVEGEREGEPSGRRVAMPPDAPPLARRLFDACTQVDPTARPTAAQLVEWLRGGE